MYVRAYAGAVLTNALAKIKPTNSSLLFLIYIHSICIIFGLMIANFLITRLFLFFEHTEKEEGESESIVFSLSYVFIYLDNVSNISLHYFFFFLSLCGLILFMTTPRNSKWISFPPLNLLGHPFQMNEILQAALDFCLATFLLAGLS